MKRFSLRPWTPAAVFTLLLAPWAFATPTTFMPAILPPAPLVIDVGSTGADGTFAPAQDVQIDLAVSGTYDPAKWAVIFNYTNVLIPYGVTVTFKNHPSRAPVVWLVQGNVTIAGTVSLDAQPGSSSNLNLYYAEPGPGGFRGGIGSAGTGYPAGSGGFGPGGSVYNTTATHATGTNTYNNPTIPYLIGGSGTGAYSTSNGGGAGGGAILIAANGTINVSQNGRISARGSLSGANQYYASGGSIKLIANSVTLQAVNLLDVNSSAPGRIRIEANSTSTIITNPPASVSNTPGPVFPTPAAPTVRIVSIGGAASPLDPRSGLGGSGMQADVSIPSSGNTAVLIECQNAPLNSTVVLHITGANSTHAVQTVTSGANPLVGTLAQSQVTATVNLAQGVTAIQARVVLP